MQLIFFHPFLDHAGQNSLQTMGADPIMKADKKIRMVQKSLRFPETLAEWLGSKAEVERRSFNQMVIMTLEIMQRQEVVNPGEEGQ